MTETCVLHHHGEQLATHSAQIVAHDKSLTGIERKLDRLNTWIIGVLVTAILTLIRVFFK